MNAGVLQNPVTNGLPQRQNTGGGGISGLVVLDGSDAGLLDVLRGIEIGLTGAKRNYVNAAGLHVLGH